MPAEQLHPHEIINQLRRVLALLEVTHHEALKLRVVFEEADDDAILELTDLLFHVRSMVEDHEFASPDHYDDAVAARAAAHELLEHTHDDGSGQARGPAGRFVAHPTVADHED